MKTGFVAISIVLIMSVVLVGIILTTALLGIGEAQTGLAHANGEIELNLVEGCMEQALIKIWNSASYSGETLGSCIITVNNVSGTYTVTVTSSNTAFRRTVQTTLTRTSQINLLSWTEI